MRVTSLALGLFVLIAVACSGEGEYVDVPETPAPTGGTDAGKGKTDSSSTQNKADAKSPTPTGNANLRIVAGNISTGGQSYTNGEGIRIFKGLKADVALVQEMNYKANSETDIGEFVTEAFGADYSHYRESGSGIQIPNGVVSKFPIVSSGRWVDPKVANRGFAWAKITVPGAHPLWAVSVHLLTDGDRQGEAEALVGELKNVVAEGDYVVVGGDLNTTSRTEGSIVTFSELLKTTAPHPVDQAGKEQTNAPRSKIYDWVLAGTTLAALQVPTVIGANSFPAGLVFDSRVYTPLEDVAPVQQGDSEAPEMQHMAIVKDFALP